MSWPRAPLLMVSSSSRTGPAEGLISLARELRAQGCDARFAGDTVRPGENVVFTVTVQNPTTTAQPYTAWIEATRERVSAFANVGGRSRRCVPAAALAVRGWSIPAYPVRAVVARANAYCG